MDIYKNKKKVLQERDRQKVLKTKYEIDENVIIKETSNMGKFLIQNLKQCFHVFLDIVVTVLVGIGIISLIYDNVRAELFYVLKETLKVFY